MSLVAWYPLNGNLNDYSGNGRHGSGSGFTVTDGKLGKSYTFDNKAILAPMKLGENGMVIKEYSTTAWVYPTSTPTAHGYNICSFGGNSMIRYRLTTSNTIWILWGGTGTNYSNMETNFTIPLNKWSHLAITIKEDEIKVYLNGTLMQIVTTNVKPVTVTATNLIIGGYNTENTNEFWRGKLNDIRIYDNILSQKEISEIAKAKILHYNFNAPEEEGTVNIYSNYPQPTGISTADNATIKQTFAKLGNGHYKVRLEKKVDGNYWPNLQFPVYNAIAGLPYTFSIELKIIERQGSASAEIRHAAIQNDYWTSGRKVHSFSAPKDWYRPIITRTFTDTYLNGTVVTNKSTRIEIYTNMHKAGDVLEFEFKNYQMEQKDHSTIFTHNARSGVICDSSGYGNHIPWTNTFPKWTSNTNIGSGAYDFTINSNQSISKGGLTFSSEDYTVSVWFNKRDIAHYHGIFEMLPMRGLRIMSFEDGHMRFHPLGLNHGSVYHDFTYQPNTWYNIVGVISAKTSKLYINGVKHSEKILTNKITDISNNSIKIGQDDGYSNRVLNGIISDVELYATALSDADILSLYQSKGSVSKSGQFYTNEIVESENRIKIIKNIKANVTTNEWKALYTGSPTGEFNISSLVESDKTLGNTYLEGQVYISSLNYKPGTFEYTRLNNEQGFITQITPANGIWKVGWNYFRQKVTGYNNAALTDWSNMNRIEIYHNGIIPTSNLTEYIEYKDVYLVKNTNLNKTGVNKKSQLNCQDINEVEFDEFGNLKIFKNGSIVATEFIEV